MENHSLKFLYVLVLGKTLLASPELLSSSSSPLLSFPLLIEVYMGLVQSVNTLIFNVMNNQYIHFLCPQGLKAPFTTDLFFN